MEIQEAADPDLAALLDPIRRIHESIRDQVVAACEKDEIETLSRIEREAPEDTLYAIDRVAEERLLGLFEREVASLAPIALIAEGLSGESTILPRGTEESAARWRVIVDPIDGTRGLMFQKRSAWILTGVAPNRGRATGLQDIRLAVQTEIPLVKQHLCDTLWAMRGAGAQGERFNRLTGHRTPLHLQPSRAETIAGGFAAIARFFPGAREELAAIDDEIVTAALGPRPASKALCFEDQYVSTGGQLYELMAGHDRFIADLRPLMNPFLERRGEPPLFSAHPYDLCAELIAREAGVIVLGPRGGPLAAPLDLTTPVAWAGYANEAIRRQVEPPLRAALEKRGLLPGFPG